MLLKVHGIPNAVFIMLVWHNYFYSNANFMVLMSFAIAQTKKINTPLPQSRKCQLRY